MAQEEGALVIVAFQDLRWRCQVIERILIAKPEGSLWALRVRKMEGGDEGYEFYVTQGCIQEVLVKSREPCVYDPDLQAELEMWRKEQGEGRNGNYKGKNA